jgi:hypothetical protein
MSTFSVKLTHTQEREVIVAAQDRDEAVREALAGNLGFVAEEVTRLDDGQPGPSWIIAGTCEACDAPLFAGESVAAGEGAELCAECARGSNG